MGQKEKLLKQLSQNPSTFSFTDADSLLIQLGFSRSNKGKTSGSRVKYTSKTHGCILLHKPHPQKELKHYQIKQLILFLEQEGFL